MTERELANASVACGDLPLQHDRKGCGARDWRTFTNALLDRAAGERRMVCQACGAGCLVQLVADPPS